MRNGPKLSQPSRHMFTWNCSLGARRLVCGGGLYLGRLGWRENTEMSQAMPLSLSEHSSPREILGWTQVRLIQNEGEMRGKVIIEIICIHLLSTHYMLSDEKVQEASLSGFQTDITNGGVY